MIIRPIIRIKDRDSWSDGRCNDLIIIGGMSSGTKNVIICLYSVPSVINMQLILSYFRDIYKSALNNSSSG